MGSLQNLWSSSSITGRSHKNIIVSSSIIQPPQPSNVSKSNNKNKNKNYPLCTTMLAFPKCMPLCSRTDNAILKQDKAMTVKASVIDDVDDTNADDGLPEGLQRELMPGHVALILDGNRRWAKQKGLSHVEGYQVGINAARDFIRLCTKWGIPVASLFMFSIENFYRPKEEVDYLLLAFQNAMKDELDNFMRRAARVSVIGDTSLLPTSLRKTIEDTEEATKNNTKLQLILAMGYSGQNDITQACQSIATKVKNGVFKPEDVTKSLIEQELQTNVSGMPYPDLLIRTSGELRISNYYLWQAAYTEMYFTHTLWPDFGEDEFIKALCSFQKRRRRFGKE